MKYPRPYKLSQEIIKITYLDNLLTNRHSDRELVMPFFEAKCMYFQKKKKKLKADLWLNYFYLVAMNSSHECF